MSLSLPDVILLAGVIILAWTYILTNQQKPRLSPRERMIRQEQAGRFGFPQLAFYFSIYLPLFMHLFNLGRLPEGGERFQIGGLLVYLMGIAWLIWARVIQGQYWAQQARGRLKSKILDSGPYALVRYPFYLGVIWAMAGLGMAWGSWLIPLCALLLVLPAAIWRARLEDETQKTKLGTDYEAYMQRVSAIFPWPPRPNSEDR